MVVLTEVMVIMLDDNNTNTRVTATNWVTLSGFGGYGGKIVGLGTILIHIHPNVLAEQGSDIYGDA